MRRDEVSKKNEKSEGSSRGKKVGLNEDEKSVRRTVRSEEIRTFSDLMSPCATWYQHASPLSDPWAASSGERGRETHLALPRAP